MWAVEFVLAVNSARNETAVEHVRGANLTIVAGPGQLAAAAPFGADFDVTGNGSILLSGKQRLFELPAGGDGLVDAGAGAAPQSLAVDSRDVVLSITDGFLGVLSGGDPKARSGVPLPYENARLSHSARPGAVYLFGGQDRDYRLYRFLEDGTFQVLLTTDEPIVAATDSAQGTYAATGHMIVRIEWPSAVVLFRAPDETSWGPIISLAAADDGLLFFSTPGKVFALRGGIALSVVNDSSGALRIRNERLYVLDPHRRLLYALSPASLDMFKRAGQ